MFGKYLALCAVAALATAAPALAEDAARSASKKRGDPNEVVCEKTEIIGSRLGSKKVCKTRAEWAEQRRVDRMEIDKAQISRGSCDGCP